MFTRLLIFILSLLSTSAPLFAQWQWVDNSQSSANYERVEDVAVDDTRGVIYSVGFVTGNPSFPEISAASLSGGDDGFVMKYDMSGNVIWAFPIGGSGNDRVHGVAVDEATGNIYITGYIRGSFASNGTKLSGISGGASGNVTGTSGNDDAFVACYNVFGQLVWYKIIGGSGVDRGMDIDVNASGVFMTGIFTNNGLLGTLIPILPINGEINNFVVALNSSNGNTLWDAVLSSTSDDYTVPSSNEVTKRTGISADANGVYLVTYFGGSTYRVYNSSDNLSTSISDPNGSQDDFVVTSYTNSGGHNWSVLYDNVGTVSFGLDITNDCSGVYVSGSLHDGGITPGGSVVSSVHDDFILSKLNKSNGNEIWLKEFNSSANHDDHFIGIDVDRYGNLYAVGRLKGTQVSMGSEINYSGGSNDDKVMIAHFHTNGVFQSFEVLLGDDDSWAMSVATYRNEKYIVGGYYNDDLNFGALSPSSNQDNAFIAVRNLAPAVDYVSSTGNEFSGSPAFCQSEGSATPDLNVPVGGVYTAPLQVVFTNASTGEIDLNASTPGGPYTISYGGSTLSCVGGPFTATIYILADQDASFTYVDNNFCKNEPNPSPASVTTPGGIFSGSPQLVFVNTSTGEIDIAASTVGGPYNLIYTTPGAYCPSSDTIQVYVRNSPDPSFGYSNSSYCGSTGSIFPTYTVTAGGVFSGPPGVVFVSTSTGEIDLNTSIPGGPYAIQYTASNGACEASAIFNITIIQPDDASFTYASDHLCTNEPNALPSSITNPGGVFFAPTGLIVTNASTGEIGASVSTVGGPYQLFYTTNGGACPGTDSMEFYIEAAPDASFAYAQSTFCAGSGTVLPSSLAEAGGTFSASPAGLSLVNNTTGEININTSTVGTNFTVKYVISNAYCEDSSTFNLIILPNEIAFFSYADDHFCNNEPNPSAASITQPGGTFSGPTELVFANTSTGEIDVAASTAGGPYYLVYTTSGANCPSSDSIQIYIEDSPDPTFAYGQSLYCTGTGSVLPSSVATPGGLFTAPAGIVFVNATTGEIDLNASTPGGPYTIQYLITNSYCQDSSTFILTIVQTEDAAFTYVGDHFCNNEPNPSAATINTPGGTFSGPTELVFANTSTGEIDVAASTVGGSYYLVYTTSGANCPSSDSIQIYIEDSPDPTFAYGQTLYCTGTGSVLPSSVATPGGLFTAPVGIVFVNAITGEIDLNASTPGGPYTIQYLITNSYCQDSSTFNLTIVQTEDASFTYSADDFCTNESNPVPTFIATPGGTFSGPIELVFANTATGEIDAAASTPGGPYTIVYTTNGANCPNSDSIEVDIVSPPDASFAYSQSLYCSSSGAITPSSIATSGGIFSGPTEIDFVDVNTGEINLNTSLVGGPYTIQYTVSNTYCQESSTFILSIEQTEDATFSYAETHFCNNEANPTPTSITTPGGTFFGSAGLIVDNASGEIDVVNSTLGGPYELIYTTNGVNCPMSDTIEVYIEAGPDPSFSYAQSSYCNGAGTVILPSAITTPGGTFSGPAGIVVDSNTGAIDINASAVGGPFSIQYLVSNTYCQKSTTFDITIIQQDDLVSVNYSSQEYCISDANQTPVITGLSGGVFSGPASIDLVNTTTGEFSPSTSVAGGPYLIQYVTPGVCPDSIDVPIILFDIPTADAGEDQELYFTFSSTLDADPALVGEGKWSSPSNSVLIDDAFNPFSDVTDLSLGKNTFIWTVSNGVCPVVADEMIIEVFDLFIPQAVTPNDDGKNDFFELHSLTEATCELQIFNRWGQIIYENSDYQNEWYGQNMKGQQLENDTYFYVILINDSISYNGYVVLKK